MLFLHSSEIFLSCKVCQFCGIRERESSKEIRYPRTNTVAVLKAFLHNSVEAIS